MQWAQYLPQNLPQATPTNNLEAQQRQYINSLEAESKAAAEYIYCLESLLYVGQKVAEFSQEQDYLINQFLHNPEFTLAYISGAWYNQKFSDEFLSGLSQLFLAISDNHPLPENKGGDSLNPQQPQIPQMPPLPPLPTSFNGGNINGGELINAAKNGNPAAMAAALQNPALMYQSLFQ